MPLVIGCISQKGGVGKTTLARALAVTYAKAGWSVKIADLDPGQASAVEWAITRNRAKIEPAIAAEPFRSVAAALRHAQSYELLVLDGKPYSSRETLDVARMSDLVLIPSCPTLDDLRPAINLARELQAAGIDAQRLCFVLTMTLKSEPAIADARLFIQKFGFDFCEATLPSRDAYRQAQNDGRSILETRFRHLNERADELMQEIVNMTVALGRAA